VANATLLANFAPVVVAFGAWLLFRERFRAQFLLGLGLALAGVVVLMGDSTSLDARHALGDLLGLLTALFYGGYLLAVSRLRRRLRTATIMAWSGTATALALFPLAVLSGEGLVAATWSGWSGGEPAAATPDCRVAGLGAARRRFAPVAGRRCGGPARRDPPGAAREQSLSGVRVLQIVCQIQDIG
jgi:hypothetical protein